MRLLVTVEPNWAHGTQTSYVDLDPADFEDYTEAEKHAVLEEIAKDTVNEMCPWGWEVVDE